MSARLTSKLRWPPRGLGLGTPLNSALASAVTRHAFWGSLWLYLLAGIATAIAMMGLDLLLFSGVSQEHVRALGAQPVLVRCLVVLYSAITEELEFRLVLATLVAWIALLALSGLDRPSPSVAIWLSILVSALLFGLAHVGNLPNVPHPYLRAVTLNGVAGIVLGWLYWRRGLEAAIAAHLAADVFIYFGLASML
jgi:membrane protease YdiL (CAAX protease family)